MLDMEQPVFRAHPAVKDVVTTCVCVCVHVRLSVNVTDMTASHFPSQHARNDAPHSAGVPVNSDSHHW